MSWQKYLGLGLILSALYGAGMGTGAALWYGHVQKQIVYVQSKGKDASDIVLPRLGDSLVKLESDKGSIKEGITHVSDNPVCNLARGDVSLLNHARTGVPDTPTLADAEKRATSTITQRAEADAHAQCGLQYRDLAARHDALIDWLELSGRR